MRLNIGMESFKGADMNHIGIASTGCKAWFKSDHPLKVGADVRL